MVFLLFFQKFAEGGRLLSNIFSRAQLFFSFFSLHEISIKTTKDYYFARVLYQTKRGHPALPALQPLASASSN